MVCSSASMFLFSIHILQFTSLIWHHCRNTCWFGNSCVIDCYSRFFGCLHILCYGAWLSFVQSLPVTLLVLCFASCASFAGLLVLSFLVLSCFAKQLVRLLLWFRGSLCPLQCAPVCDCLSVLLTLWVFIIYSYDQHESSDILNSGDR